MRVTTCSACGGRENADCICGGEGTIWAERDGLQARIRDLTELRALVEKWRKQAERMAQARLEAGNTNSEAAIVKDNDADELEALIERIDGHPRTRG